MGSQRSKEDEVQKMSISVFITNFPDSFSAKDLFKTCSQYGTPLNKENIHVNKKYEEARSSPRNFTKDNGTTGTTKAYSHAVKGGSHSVNEEVANTPAMVLEDDCLNMQDLTNSYWMSELWVLLKFESEDSKVDDQEDGWPKKILVGCLIFWKIMKRKMNHMGSQIEGALKGDDEALKSCSNFGEDINVEKVSETKFEDQFLTPPYRERIIGIKPNEDVEDQNNKNDDFEKMNGDCSHTFSKKGPSDSDDIAESICSGQFKRSEIPRTSEVLHNTI
ncbi:hypothetical protein Tco_0972320 [Tanacetum coccineum]